MRIRWFTKDRQISGTYLLKVSFPHIFPRWQSIKSRFPFVKSVVSCGGLAFWRADVMLIYCWQRQWSVWIINEPHFCTLIPQFNSTECVTTHQIQSHKQISFSVHSKCTMIVHLMNFRLIQSRNLPIHETMIYLFIAFNSHDFAFFIEKKKAILRCEIVCL